MKDVIFHCKAIEALRDFPDDARRSIGKAIRDLQRGLRLEMPLSRAMPSVALGAAELRVKDKEGIYRTFYYTKHRKGILIFHAFVKKTQKTPQREIDIGRQRLREMLNEKEK